MEAFRLRTCSRRSGNDLLDLGTADFQLGNELKSSISFTLLDISVRRSIVSMGSCTFEAKYACEFRSASTFPITDNSRIVV
jgi:hypothetical protein